MNIIDGYPSMDIQFFEIQFFKAQEIEAIAQDLGFETFERQVRPHNQRVFPKGRTGFERTGFQRTGYPSMIFIDGYPSINIIDGYPVL